MGEFMDLARAEAEREVARRDEALWENEGEHLSHTWGRGFEAGFMEGAQWAHRREVESDD